MRERGRLFWAGAFVLFWAVGILAARLLPLGDEPRNHSERRYHQNAIEMRHYLNDNPIAGLLTRLLVYRISVGGMKEVANSCDGGSDGGLPQYRDTIARVTDHTIYGLPIGFYQASCSGNGIHRGLPDARPRPAPEPVTGSQSGDGLPPPPSPGVSPPPAPSPPSAAPR